jgi:hypothetical protein
VAAGAALARAGPPETALARAAVLLAPPCLLGAVFGTGALLVMASVGMAALLVASGRAFVLAALLVAGALMVTIGKGEWEPGLGLSNLCFYGGVERGAPEGAGAALVALVVILVLLVRLGRRLRSDPAAAMAWTALGLIAILWLAPSESPDAVAAPIAALAVAATLGTPPRIDSPAPAL